MAAMWMWKWRCASRKGKKDTSAKEKEQKQEIRYKQTCNSNQGEGERGEQQHPNATVQMLGTHVQVVKNRAEKTHNDHVASSWCHLPNLRWLEVKPTPSSETASKHIKLSLAAATWSAKFEGKKEPTNPNAHTHSKTNGQTLFDTLVGYSWVGKQNVKKTETLTALRCSMSPLRPSAVIVSVAPWMNNADVKQTVTMCCLVWPISFGSTDGCSKVQKSPPCLADSYHSFDEGVLRHGTGTRAQSCLLKAFSHMRCCPSG